MADDISINSSAQQIQQNYEKYSEYFTEDPNSELGQDQFLALMVEQMKNQDFMDPTDNSEYIAQMAQFSMTQQIQQMNYYTNATYATSLVGKTVRTGMVDVVSNDIITSTGVVSAVKLNGTSFEVVVDGKTYQLSNIMEVLSEIPAAEQVFDKEQQAQTIETTSDAKEDTDTKEVEEPNYTQDIF